MCGRYVSPDQAAIERERHIGRANSNPLPRRFNVAPTDLIPILCLDRESGELELTAARWGLIPNWWKDAKPPAPPPQGMPTPVVKLYGLLQT